MSDPHAFERPSATPGNPDLAPDPPANPTIKFPEEPETLRSPLELLGRDPRELPEPVVGQAVNQTFGGLPGGGLPTGSIVGSVDAVFQTKALELYLDFIKRKLA